MVISVARAAAHWWNFASHDPWKTFEGILLGAGISLVTTWFVGPRVERRKRREQRREDALVQVHALARTGLRESARALRADRSAILGWEPHVPADLDTITLP